MREWQGSRFLCGDIHIKGGVVFSHLTPDLQDVGQLSAGPVGAVAILQRREGLMRDSSTFCQQQSSVFRNRTVPPVVCVMYVNDAMGVTSPGFQTVAGVAVQCIVMWGQQGYVRLLLAGSQLGCHY